MPLFRSHLTEIIYLFLISSNFPHSTDTLAVFPGKTSLLIPYGYSQVISASVNGYFASQMVIPFAQPLIFKSEKDEYVSEMKAVSSDTIAISE